jgi:uncharacterized protein YceH (UPF0502 family)
MTKPTVHAFFVGRALAQGIAEQLERGLTDALSEVGKFDAEQRERLRQFTDQVLQKATEAEVTNQPDVTASSEPSSAADLQEMIDDLRAEVAQLRTKLREYQDSLV